LRRFIGSETSAFEFTLSFRLRSLTLHHVAMNSVPMTGPCGLGWLAVLPIPILGLALFGCQQAQGPSAAVFTPTENERFFVEEIKPVLERKCLRCHDGKTLPSRLDLSTRETAFAVGSNERAYIVPGRPEKSLLFEAIGRSGTHPRAMPQALVSLSDEELGTFSDWIAAGAHWPKGARGVLHPQSDPESPRP
jgi:hypothetical protein